MRRLSIILLLLLCGCITIAPTVEPARAAYLAGKDVAYGLWRFEAVSLADLQKAKAPLNALLAALEAPGEPELDQAIQTYLDNWIAALSDADREIVRELVAETLADVQLKDPDILADKDRAALAALVGGILDGIALAERAAAGGA